MVLLVSYGPETRGEQCATYMPSVLLTTIFPWKVMGLTLFGALGSFFPAFFDLTTYLHYSLIPLHQFHFHIYKTRTNPNCTWYKTWISGSELHRFSSIHNKIGTRLQHTILILISSKVFTPYGYKLEMVKIWNPSCFSTGYKSCTDRRLFGSSHSARSPLKPPFFCLALVCGR